MLFVFSLIYALGCLACSHSGENSEQGEFHYLWLRLNSTCSLFNKAFIKKSVARVFV